MAELRKPFGAILVCRAGSKNECLPLACHWYPEYRTQLLPAFQVMILKWLLATYCLSWPLTRKWKMTYCLWDCQGFQASKKWNRPKWCYSNTQCLNRSRTMESINNWSSYWMINLISAKWKIISGVSNRFWNYLIAKSYKFLCQLRAVCNWAMISQ